MPNARLTDPETSVLAALSVIGIKPLQDVILKILEKPMCDHELVREVNEWVRYGFADRASESGIRTRRAELVKQGKVVDTGERGMTPSGRKTIIWAVAE
jgi:hypothetical protein